MKTLSLSKEQLKVLAKNYMGFFELPLNRISSILIIQIFQLHGSRTFDTYEILNEIRYMEGLNNHTATPHYKTFLHEPLKGLRKKHFTQSAFVFKNISNYFNLAHGGNENLDRLINKAFLDSRSLSSIEEFAKFLAHSFTFCAYNNKKAKSKLTGEWIVFKEYKSKNYYLTLASHDESDMSIYKRVCDSYMFDFRFLSTDSD